MKYSTFVIFIYCSINTRYLNSSPINFTNLMMHQLTMCGPAGFCNINQINLKTLDFSMSKSYKLCTDCFCDSFCFLCAQKKDTFSIIFHFPEEFGHNVMSRVFHQHFIGPRFCAVFEIYPPLPYCAWSCRGKSSWETEMWNEIYSRNTPCIANDKIRYRYTFLKLGTCILTGPSAGTKVMTLGNINLSQYFLVVHNSWFYMTHLCLCLKS